MNKSVYGGDPLALGETTIRTPRLPEAGQIAEAAPLVNQASALLATLTAGNKPAIISQLDNIRHQLMVIAGNGADFIPFNPQSTTTNRNLGPTVQLKNGTLTVE